MACQLGTANRAELSGRVRIATTGEIEPIGLPVVLEICLDMLGISGAAGLQFGFPLRVRSAIALGVRKGWETFIFVTRYEKGHPR